MVKEDNKLCDGDNLNEVNYKNVVNRIDRIASHSQDLVKILSGYAKKSSTIRDKNDEIAKCLAKYSNKVEDMDTTSRLSMRVCAELFAKVGDHQTAAVQRLETKVLPNFSSYGRICKCLKIDARNATTAQDRVLSRRKIATAFSERISERADSKYRDVITDAERDLENAMAESSRLDSLFQEQIIKFEHKRLIDLKETLETFFKIEIAKHAKSLELLTEAYKYIHSIDEDADLEVIKEGLKLRELQEGMKPYFANKPKSSKNAKTENSNPEETEDEDASLSPDFVQKLEEMMYAQPRRSATKVPSPSQEKDSSANRKQSTPKSGNPTPYQVDSKHPSQGNHKGYEAKDDKHLKKKEPHGSTNANNDGKRSGTAPVQGSQKSAKKVDSSSSVSRTNSAQTSSLRPQRDNFQDSGQQRQKQRQQVDTHDNNKKVSFDKSNYRDERDRDRYQRSGQPETNYGPESTTLKKFGPKNQFL